MELQGWILIGIVVAAEFVWFHLERRIDRTHARMDGVTQRMDKLGAGYDSRFDRVNARVDRVDTRLGTIEDRGRELADAIYSAAQTLDDHLRRHAS